MLTYSINARSKYQYKAMFRHGIWEWSLKNCPEALRQKGYWYALKEVGGFENVNQILNLEKEQHFLNGWEYMTQNAANFGLAQTCDYAYKQWPAILYRHEN